MWAVSSATPTADESAFVRIEQCGNDGAVSGTTAVGGILGYSESECDEIFACYNAASVTAKAITGNNGTGGVAGFFAGQMDSCYNCGAVSCTGNAVSSGSQNAGVGGLVGLAYACDIDNSYNSGSLSGDGSSYVKLGGIAGYIYYGTSDASNTYYLESGSLAAYGAAINTSASLTGDYASKTSAELMALAGTLGGNFQSNGDTGYHGGYPVLTWEDVDHVHAWDEGKITKEPRYFGGIAGDYNYSTGNGKIINCYTTGTVTYDFGSARDTGIIVGESGYSTNSYFLDTALANSGSAVSQFDGISKTEAELKAAASLLGEAYQTDCGNYPVLDWQDADAHTASEAVTENEVEASCTTPASYDSVVKCSECGAEISRETITVEDSMLDHTYSTEWSNDETSHWHECGCGDKTDVAEHSFVGDVCEVCDYERDHVHNLTYTEAKAATCTESGNIEYWYCDVCEKLYADEGCENEVAAEDVVTAALNHAWDEGTVTTEPGCETKGVMTYTCENDPTHTKTEEIDAIDHAWDEGTVTTEPGCETKGVMTYTCENDPSHTKTEEIPATGHSYEDGTCTNCGEKDPDYVPEEEEPSVPSTPVKPSWQSWLDKIFGSWWGDDEEEEACEHSYTSVVTDPTCTEEGYTTHTCDKCGDSYTDSYVDATGHSYVDGVCEHCGAKESTKPGWSWIWFWPFW